MTELRAPQRKASLSAQLVDSLRDQITSGTWPVGTRLPSEHELVDRLGVSRTTLREALGALTHMGLLEARAGDGTYVRASDGLAVALVHRAATARRQDVLELRAVLEEYAAGLAALRRDADDLDRMQTAVTELDLAGRSGSIAAVVDADAAFHQAVVRAGGNPLLAELYEHLGRASSAFLGELPLDQDLHARHVELHQALVDAVEQADETGSRYAAARIVALAHTAPPA